MVQKTVKTKKMIRNKSATHPPSSHFPQNFHQLRLSSHEPKLQTKKTLWRTLASNHLTTPHTTCHLSISTLHSNLTTFTLKENKILTGLQYFNNQPIDVGKLHTLCCTLLKTCMLFCTTFLPFREAFTQNIILL